MKVDFSAAREAATKEGLIGGSDYLKIKDGANRIRLASEAIPHKGDFKGKPTFKWLCYVIDRSDSRVKPYFMPNVIHSMIADLQRDPEWAFDEVPMPYDITINAKNAGTKEVEYSVSPARKATPLTGAEQTQIDAQKPLGELQEALRARDNQDKPQDTENGEVPF